MDDTQTQAAEVVHPPVAQQASDVLAPGDWSGHVPAAQELTVAEQHLAALAAAGITPADLAAALQRGAALAEYLADSGTPDVAELIRNALALAPLCCACGSAAVGYRNFAAQPFCRPCATGETPVDTASTLIAASEAQAHRPPISPTVTPANAIAILRAHADYLDPDGTAVPPVNALTAATLRMAAQFLEDVAPEPLPRRQRLRPGLLRQMILATEARQGAIGPVDVQFVPVPAAAPTEQDGATP